MKKILIIFCMIISSFLIFADSAMSQEEATVDDVCLQQTETNSPEEPLFLSPGWGGTQNMQLAVIYFDFPDGRANNHGNLVQPTTISELQNVPNFDAAGEVGLTFDESPFPVTGNSTTLYTNPAKYTWQDRYNMFFSTGHTYEGDVHPDYQTHNSMYGDQAFGSMKEYWTEVSNGKLNVVPATTHPLLGAEYQGIVNDYISLPDGREMINYITLPRKKYGAQSDSYMPDYYWYTYSSPPDAGDLSRIEMMGDDMITALRNRYTNGQSTFNYDAFISGGGKCIFIFAGSSYRFKGIGPPSGCIVRNMNAKPDTINCRIDGLSNMTHEFGHHALGFGHTTSGRYDLMNVYMSKDINCPSHLNPVYKLKKGWLDAVPYEHTMSEPNLPPIETSHKCGIVTIYGKPTVSPDHLAGECYILENRRRIGFDREILSHTNPGYDGLNGGLLIWHYSPYTQQPMPGCSSEDASIRFVPADPNVTLGQMCGDIGNPLHFFGHSSSFPISAFGVARTYSAENLKTGIQITGISQTDYNKVNSGMSFTLQYTISEPPAYDHVVYNRGTTPTIYSLHDKIYYHDNDPNANYIFYENAQLETVAGRGFVIGPFKSRTHDNNPILFKAAGYQNSTESYMSNVGGITCKGTCLMDSVVADNVKIQDINGDQSDFILWSIGINFPVVVRNITVSSTNSSNPDSYDVALLQNRNYSKIDLSNCNVFLASTGIGAEFDSDIKVQYGNLKLTELMKFKNGSGVVLNYASAYSSPTNLVMSPKNSFDTWKGIEISYGNIGFTHATFNNALNGIQVNIPSHDLSITNSTFNNSIGSDITVQGAGSSSRVGTFEILNNTFNCNSNFQYASIACTDVIEGNIANNTLNYIGQSGIALTNCLNATVYGNTVIGGNSNDGYSTGIISYASDGWFNCNTIQNCLQYGMLLDNSLPVLFSNVVENNGIGLFLTNNSHPLMTEGYSSNQTYEIGGVNKISNSAGPEIYIDNDPISYSNPEINYGINIIQDDLGGVDRPDTLIFNSNLSVRPPSIKCANNSWGGGDPGGRLVPASSFSYNPYLGAIDPAPCEFSVLNEDNSSIPEYQLLLGNYMIARYKKNYGAALGYSYDMFNLPDNDASRLLSLNNIFNLSVINNSDLAALGAFYESIMNKYPQNTILKRAANNLRIEAKVQQRSFAAALKDYTDLINSSSDEKEAFYAGIEKSRIAGLMIHNLLTDESKKTNSDIPNSAIDNLIANGISTIKDLNLYNSKNSRTNKMLNNLKSGIDSKFSDMSKLSTVEKTTLLLADRLVRLAAHNYNPNIGSIQRKGLKNTVNTIALTYELSQNYPNPFNPVTSIHYSLPKAGFVSIKIYDVVGRMVKELVNETKETGSYSVSFDGSQFASGIYFYRMEANNFVDTKRMVLVK